MPVCQSTRSVPPVVTAWVVVVLEGVVVALVVVVVPVLVPVLVVVLVLVVVEEVVVVDVVDVLLQPLKIRLPTMMMIRDRNNSFFIAYLQTSLQ